MDEEKLAAERLRGRVEYWKQIVSIQMHFNDMCIRTRWLGLTAIATILAAAAVSARENITFKIQISTAISLSSVLMIIALIMFLALYFLDLQYYYRMLLASVDYAEKYEEDIAKDLALTDDGITKAISKSVSRSRASFVSKIFYVLTGTVILVALVGSFLPRN